MVDSKLNAPVRGKWWSRHVRPLKTTFRILFGVIWIIDGALKFTSGFVSGFPDAVQASAASAPAWLSAWYSFWVAEATAYPWVIVYTVGLLELALGIALVAGFLRKIAYVGGAALSLLIWAVPEGFGGPYASGAGGTDVGTGAVYALMFLGLMVMNSAFGPSRFSLDYLIERRFPAWAKLAELGEPDSGAIVPPAFGPAGGLSMGAARSPGGEGWVP